MSSVTKVTKSECLWPISCELVKHEIATGIWVTVQWQLKSFDLYAQSLLSPVISLQLYRDEMRDYRFNLSSRQPKLFLVLDHMTNEHQPDVVVLTASHSVASQYLDGDYLVLSNHMPHAVQTWIGDFLEQHCR